MPHISRDTAFLARPVKAGLLTLITVADPWLRTMTSNVAIRQKGFEPRTLPDDAGPAGITRAAAARPLIGKPLIRANLSKQQLDPDRLAQYCTDLAAAAKNPTVICYSLDTKEPLTEDLKEIPEKAQWLIIRQTDFSKKAERNALVDHILHKLYKPIPLELEDWYTAIDQWVADQPEEETTPTVLRSTCELLQLVAADPLGRLDVKKVPDVLAMDRVPEWKFPDIMGTLMTISLANNRGAQLSLIQQVAKYTRTPEDARMLASVIETTTIEMATSTTKIPQQDDPKTHEYRRKILRTLGNIDPRQMTRSANIASRLAHAIRTNAYPVSAVATILLETELK